MTRNPCNKNVGFVDSIVIQCSNIAKSSTHWSLRKGMRQPGMGGGGG
jgi:hypothetical protein